MQYLFWSLWYLLALVTIWFLYKYFRRFSYWFSRKPKSKLINDKKNKLALIIPARNEGKTIIPLLESINNQTYDNFVCHIIVKEETDIAIDIIHEMVPSAHVYIDKEQDRKGHALDYALKEILKNKEVYDAYVFIDADCLLDSKFMEEMNNSLASGCDVINSRLAVKNYLVKGKKINTWAAKCNGLIWPLMNQLGNQAKSNQGLVTMTTGTGLMITSKLICEWGGWPFNQTMSEDIELQRTCILNNYSCYYTNDAVCYVEEASSLKVTNMRRMRWLSGVVQCDRIYRDPIDEMIKNTDDIRAKKSKYACYNLYYTYWYYGIVAIIGLIGLIVGTLSFFNLDLLSNFHGYLVFFSCLGIIYGSFLILGIVAMIADRKYIKLNPFQAIWLALTFPIFQAMYYPVMAYALFHKYDCEWHTVARVDFSNGKER